MMMKRVIGALLILTGCSDNYLPLTDDHSVHILMVAGDRPLTIDGGEYGASVTACISPSDRSWPCGRLVVPEGYDEDVFSVYTEEFGSYEMTCLDSGHIADDIRDSSCGALMKYADPGQQFNLIINEYDKSALVMPPRT